MYVLLKPTNLGHNASNEQNSNDFESESSTSKAEKPANKERSKKKKKNKGILHILRINKNYFTRNFSVECSVARI